MESHDTGRRRDPRARIRLISDDHGRVVPWGDLRVHAGPTAPFTPDATVLEEDTNLVLSAPAVISEPADSLDDLLEAAASSVLRAHRPGTVVVRKGRGLRLLAIVHDVDSEPTWRLPWISKALVAVFDACARNQVRDLELPLLGTAHGNVHPARIARLIARTLDRRCPDTLRRIWIPVAVERVDTALGPMRIRALG